MKHESNHAPSMQYAKDIYKVAKRLKDFTALEIGGAWGFSTLAILEAGAKSLLTVDPNQLIEAKKESEANGYTNHQWTACRSDKFWLEERDVKFDLIYVDGSHLYRDVKPDLYEAWERLNPKGLLLVDDWDHKHNQSVDIDGESVKYGVSLACWEFWRDHKDVKKVGIEGRVLWFKK